MIKTRYKVLEKVTDKFGMTLVVSQIKTKREKWCLRKKVISRKFITIWRTMETDLIIRPDFDPLTDWLVVDHKFRSWSKDQDTMVPVGPLENAVLFRIAMRELTF